MATITLKGKPKPATKTRNAEGEKRAPVRGKGVSKPRQTLTQVQAEREQRAEQRAQRERLEQAPRGPSAQRADPRSAPRDPARGPSRFTEDRPRQDRPADERGPRPPQRATPRPVPGEARAPRPDARPSRSRDERPPERQLDRPTDRPPRVDQRRASNRGPSDYPGGPPPARLSPPRRNNPAREVAPEDGERLSKRMGELKLASRREADEWIAAGWVRVDGKVAVLGQRVGPNVQIDIDPAARNAQAQLVTVLLHKPIGYVSGQAEDGYEPAVVLFQPENRWKEDASGIKESPAHHRSLAPAGRLDIDSTGLLVLTQDGRIAKHLIGGDSEVEKEYLVRVEYIGRPGAEPVPEGTLPNAALPSRDLALLAHGLELDGEALKPAKASWQNEQQLRIVLREGKKRQIRRMCELVGLKVVGLKRVRIGRIALGNLPVGQWRYLTPWERF